MQTLLARLRTLLASAPAKLEGVSETESERSPGPGRWSKKEILGHLVDSAANNHQRFVRTQAEPLLSFPGYPQEFWVSTQQYQREPWNALVDLWKNYNIHLLHIIEQIPEDKLEHRCSLGNAEPVTLRFLITDYVRHLEHHLRQIFGE
jgi:hypothetical protein